MNLFIHNCTCTSNIEKCIFGYFSLLGNTVAGVSTKPRERNVMVLQNSGQVLDKFLASFSSTMVGQHANKKIKVGPHCMPSTVYLSNKMKAVQILDDVNFIAQAIGQLY